MKQLNFRWGIIYSEKGIKTIIVKCKRIYIIKTRIRNFEKAIN